MGVGQWMVVGWREREGAHWTRIYVCALVFITGKPMSMDGQGEFIKCVRRVEGTVQWCALNFKDQSVYRPAQPRNSRLRDKCAQLGSVGLLTAIEWDNPPE